MFIFILSAFSIANNMFLRQTTITFVDKHSVSFMSSKDASADAQPQDGARAGRSPEDFDKDGDSRHVGE